MVVNNKPKKCKGSGKAASFTGCGSTVLVRRFGLCPSCWRDFLLTTPEGSQILTNATLTGKKRVNNELTKKSRQEKLEGKSIQKLIQEARIPFQKWIRYRDANLGCIACGTTDAEIYDAGHFYKAEIYSGLIFDEMNVHKECRRCNTYLHGNEGNYRNGLLYRFGQDFLDELDKKAITLRNYKWTKCEISAIKETYQRRMREL